MDVLKILSAFRQTQEPRKDKDPAGGISGEDELFHTAFVDPPLFRRSSLRIAED